MQLASKRDVPFLRLKGDELKLPSQQEMAELDGRFIAAGTPGLELMERAGSAFLERLEQSLSGEGSDRVLILCGPGNNGGDGLVVARLLQERGATRVQAVIGGARRYSGDFLHQLKSFRKAGGELSLVLGEGEIAPAEGLHLCSEEAFLESLLQAGVVVDALLGTGQSAAPRGSIGLLLNWLRSKRHTLRAVCVALDLPTGVNGDSGEVYQPCFEADHTICIQLIKRGLLQYPARSCCGAIEVVDIGIDCSTVVEFSLATPGELYWPPERRPDAHKGEFGHVLVIGGNADMPGAPWLAAEAALRVGAGLVSVAGVEGVSRFGFLPEAMRCTLDDKGLGVLGREALSKLGEPISRATVIVLGPGLGRNDETGAFVEEVLKSCNLPVVIDADALVLLAKLKREKLCSLFKKNHILTPHPGEMGALLGSSSKEVQRDRYAAIKEAGEICPGVTVLKGASSLVHSPEAGGLVNPSGTPYMATAGSGDVLSGIIAGLIAQGLTPFEGAGSGVFLHGLAGEIAHEKIRGPLLARDITAEIAGALASVRSGLTAAGVEEQG